MTPTRSILALRIAQRLLARNRILEDFFSHESARLAAVSQEMANHFLRGGRLLALGSGACSTDAQHVSVEFVHPVIVGKRALPALDLSALKQPWLEAVLQADDIVMGFGPPEGDEEVWAALDFARSRGAMTFALPGEGATYSLQTTIENPFIHQELVEIFYHTLWETVHVFLEHRELGQDVGQAEFLYPFLGQKRQETATIVDDVRASILTKVHDDTNLRTRLAREEAEKLAATAVAIHERVAQGGK